MVEVMVLRVGMCECVLHYSGNLDGHVIVLDKMGNVSFDPPFVFTLSEVPLSEEYYRDELERERCHFFFHTHTSGGHAALTLVELSARGTRWVGATKEWPGDASHPTLEELRSAFASILATFTPRRLHEWLKTLDSHIPLIAVE